ncbi:major capsid protein [Microvirus mar60]|uniref:Major capsid protein n=1 Tax=Microvirus mar60 TaxID=2851197 RepID=A0A8F5MJ75_9VIRU|nr:major capsid protein [Microvirus mar60]
MAIVKAIGKNTLGGGKKMNVSLHEYGRSTHDLSFICRTPQASGTLVPVLKLIGLPGDTFDIECRKQTMTHPTVGPLYGSFKQQTDVFFCPMRLYNALLHNNTLNIGLDMKQVKLPQLQITPRNADINTALEGSHGSFGKTINPSCLLAYLGLRGWYGKNNSEDINRNNKNMIPLLAYFDIFKNYYANKQEEKFYTIGSRSTLTDKRDSSLVKNTGTSSPVWSAITSQIVPNYNETWQIAMNYRQEPKRDEIYFGFKMNENSETTWYKWDEVFIINERTKGYEIVGAADIGAGDPAKVYNVSESFRDTHVGWTYIGYREGSGLTIKSWNLEDIDKVREMILAAGRTQVIISENSTQEGIDYIKQFTLRNSEDNLNTSEPQFGLVLKTYQSDLFTNWVNTEWLDGDNGINAITAVSTVDGKFTIDALNLSQKIYNMLNRIAVAGASYNEWIQTVYTSGGVPHYETPVYIGGWSNEIEFQEVISNAATNEEPLGSLAGRGVATNYKGSNKIHYKIDEPGYIIAINSITPRVDYCQYEEFDMNLESLDELHKPALDGIGFQDLLYRTMNIASANPTYSEKQSSVGKQPAWIDYMTNYNKTFGDFSILDKEGWMCLNRYFTNLREYTTYIHPEEFNYIFAQQSLEATNFWCQIRWDIQARRVMSAKQIPNL